MICFEGRNRAPRVRACAYASPPLVSLCHEAVGWTACLHGPDAAVGCGFRLEAWDEMRVGCIVVLDWAICISSFPVMGKRRSCQNGSTHVRITVLICMLPILLKV